MAKRYLRNIDRHSRYSGGKLSEMAFQLREGESGLSITKLPESNEQEFIEQYWESRTLPSGDRPGLALLTDDDICAAGLKPPKQVKVDGIFGDSHFEIENVDEGAAEKLALLSKERGMVRPFVCRKKGPKTPAQELCSDLYREGASSPGKTSSEGETTADEPIPD